MIIFNGNVYIINETLFTCFIRQLLYFNLYSETLNRRNFKVLDVTFISWTRPYSLRLQVREFPFFLFIYLVYYYLSRFRLHLIWCTQTVRLKLSMELAITEKFELRVNGDWRTNNVLFILSDVNLTKNFSLY